MDQRTHVSGTMTLREYVSVLKIRKWTVILCTLLGIGAGLAYSYRQTPLYTAGGALLIKPNASTGFSGAENEAAVISSASVAQLVIDDLGLSMTPAAVLGSLDTELSSATGNVINVQYTSDAPALASDITNSFMSNYVAYRRNQAIEASAAQTTTLESKLAKVRVNLSRVIQAVERARAQGNESRVVILETKRSVLAANLSTIQQQLDAVPAVPAETDLGEILEPAVQPGSPSSPDHRRNGALGFVLGLMGGVAIAFLRERLEDPIRGRADLERILEAPVLGTVPRFKVGKKRSRALPVISDPTGAASEAYRTLRTGLQFLTAQGGARTLIVSSPSAGEGKTTTTANLAVAIAAAGQHVTIVSADLRRPQIETYFGVTTDKGLSTWLLEEEEDVREVLVKPEGIANLALLPAGRVPSNPAELLTSPRLAELVAELELMSDVVLIDGPPVLPVADAAILASLVKNALLVVDAANTRRSAASHAREQIQRVGGTLVGVVLNMFEAGSTPYYYEPMYYSKYYASNAGRSKKDINA